jgi:hemin uptake protein HemP
MAEEETAGPPRAPKTALGEERRRVDSARLFEGARELLIDHEGECYRLRWTSKGKLILTK